MCNCEVFVLFRSRGPRVKLAKKMPKWTMATTTALVRQCFDKFFADQMDETNHKDGAGEKQSGPRRVRCGVCEACLTFDCGTCSACKDMIKVGTVLPSHDLTTCWTFSTHIGVLE